MKALQSSIKAWLAFTFACFLLLTLISCTRQFTLASPAQLSRLPASRGLNGGSYVAMTPWQYRSSHDSTHEFFYFYHTGSTLHRRKVSIPRQSAVLHFREEAFGTQPRWVTLRPDSTTFQFDFYHFPSFGGLRFQMQPEESDQFPKTMSDLHSLSENPSGTPSIR